MIEGYCGNVGSGKTYSMTERCLRAIRAGRTVFANYHLKGAEYFKTWDDLMGAERCLVALDELGLWANSRAYRDMPKEILSWFSQSRKGGLDIVYTAQSIEGVDAHVRRITAIRYQCEKWGPFIRERAYDGISGNYMLTRWKWTNPAVWSAYDTYEIVGSPDGRVSARVGALRLREAEAIVHRALSEGYVYVVDQRSPALRKWRRASMQDVRDEVEIVTFRGGRVEVIDWEPVRQVSRLCQSGVIDSEAVGHKLRRDAEERGSLREVA